MYPAYDTVLTRLADLNMAPVMAPSNTFAPVAEPVTVVMPEIASVLVAVQAPALTQTVPVCMSATIPMGSVVKSAVLFEPAPVKE